MDKPLTDREYCATLAPKRLSFEQRSRRAAGRQLFWLALGAALFIAAVHFVPVTGIAVHII